MKSSIAQNLELWNAERHLEQRPNVHVESQISEPRGDDLGSSIVSILTHFGHQNARTASFHRHELLNLRQQQEARHLLTDPTVCSKMTNPFSHGLEFLLIAVLAFVGAGNHRVGCYVTTKHLKSHSLD